MEWTEEEIAGLKRGQQLVLERRRYWPDQETFDLNQKLNPVPATEVAVVRGGRVLLHYREFTEWPGQFGTIKGWYIPGGYLRQPDSLAMTSLGHIRKDVEGEYKRAGIEFNLNSVELGEPLVIGQKKWMPGEHPTGCPLSLVCVCELIAGDIVETERLRWFAEPVDTNVQWHGAFIRQVLAFLHSPVEYQRWFRSLAGMVDVIGTDFLTTQSAVR